MHGALRYGSNLVPAFHDGAATILEAEHTRLCIITGKDNPQLRIHDFARAVSGALNKDTRRCSRANATDTQAVHPATKCRAWNGRDRRERQRIRQRTRRIYVRPRSRFYARLGVDRGAWCGVVRCGFDVAHRVRPRLRGLRHCRLRFRHRPIAGRRRALPHDRGRRRFRRE